MECEVSNDGSKPTPIWNIKRKGANIHHQVPVFHEPLQVFCQKEVTENWDSDHYGQTLVVHLLKTLHLDKILLVRQACDSHRMMGTSG
jgi:hypothetical protein